MAGDSIGVRATVRLLSSAEGGRTAPVKGSYRPNHNFFGPESDDLIVGFINLPWGRTLHPGDSIDLRIRFWDRPGLAAEIYPGREWRIQEGPKLVGIGKVLKVLAT